MPELVEGPRVLGLGLGLFLLVLLWSAVFAIVLVCTRLVRIKKKKLYYNSTQFFILPNSGCPWSPAWR